MSDPEKFLSKDETLIFDVHHHPSVLLPPLLLLLLVLALWIALLSLYSFMRNGWAVLAGGVVVLVLLLYFLERLTAWSRARLTLSETRVSYSYGIVSRHSMQTSLASVTDVSFHQGPLERVVGMGDVTVESAGEPALPFVRLPRPSSLSDQISEQVRHVHGAAARSGGPSAEEIAVALKMAQPTSELPPIPQERPPLYSEIVDQIERLDALRERGTLSDEEFESAKKNLLSRLEQEDS